VVTDVGSTFEDRDVFGATGTPPGPPFYRSLGARWVYQRPGGEAPPTDAAPGTSVGHLVPVTS
ncbi:MAG: hypothetical protein HY909_19450, partial [Deltaproteobacteria bacterium]|nr:hypothetical protein [Deltaproteobacteria bacterium]